MGSNVGQSLSFCPIIDRCLAVIVSPEHNSCLVYLLVLEQNPYLNPILLSKCQLFLKKKVRNSQVVPIFGNRLNIPIKVVYYASIGIRTKFISQTDLGRKDLAIFAKKTQKMAKF